MCMGAAVSSSIHAQGRRAPYGACGFNKATKQYSSMKKPTLMPHVIEGITGIGVYQSVAGGLVFTKYILASSAAAPLESSPFPLFIADQASLRRLNRPLFRLRKFRFFTAVLRDVLFSKSEGVLMWLNQRGWEI